MATIPCPQSTPCIDPANPVTNFSTEAPDANEFLSLKWPNIPPDDPLGPGPPGGPNTPPPTFNSDNCGSTCTSTISQEDADLCAARLAFNCAFNQTHPIFCNHPQTAFLQCADGNQFGFTVGACIISGQTQAGADAQAQALAQQLARDNMICISNAAAEVCINTTYGSTVTVTRGNGPFVMRIQGSLPSGITFTQTSSKTGVLTGMPTAAGNYSFSIVATDGTGNSMIKPVSICVIDITPATLANATIGVAYSAQLFATACANQTQSWQVTSGALPPGLSLDEASGMITGTPTGPTGTVTFTVTFQDNAS